jgi:hypothetical protein
MLGGPASARDRRKVTASCAPPQAAPYDRVELAMLALAMVLVVLFALLA